MKGKLEMTERLNNNEKKVYHYLIQYIKYHQYSPSNRDIAEALGLAKSTVWCTLKKLEEKNYIKKEYKKMRAITLEGFVIVEKSQVQSFLKEDSWSYE